MLSLNVIKPCIGDYCLRSIEESRSSFIECDSSLNERQFSSIDRVESDWFRSVWLTFERYIILIDPLKKVKMLSLGHTPCSTSDNSVRSI